jgi:DNA-binding XRE family transcriptional regulator
MRVALPFCSITLTARKPSKLPTVLNNVGDHIKTRRLELNLLKRDLANQIGIKTDTILNWEHKHSTPALLHFPKVIVFLGYDPDGREPNSLGEKVLQYRKSTGVIQKELAKRIGIDPTTLSRLERNEGCCFLSVLRIEEQGINIAISATNFSSVFIISSFQLLTAL